MIGTRIRGFRHLLRMAKSSSEVQIFFKHNYNNIDCGVAVYVGAACKTQYGYLMIFNNTCENLRRENIPAIDSAAKNKIKEISKNYPHVWIVSENINNFFGDTSMIDQMLAVPSDFEEKYRGFCEANKKQMQNVTRFVDINSSILKYIYAITNGSKNFFFWAVNSFFKQNISIYNLERIMLWNDGYSQLSNKLNKGTITGYTNGKDLSNLPKELSKLRRDKRANDVINMFNTAQKKALKAYSLNDRDYETLSKFGKLSLKKKNNFIRKMSTIDDPVEILKQMSFLADIHFEWKKESLLEFLKNSEGFKCEVVIDKGDMILLKVKDYETVKRLAKTTNWCISKDKKYWNEYVENRPDSTQYVLMDFSRKEDDNLSIVGFTSVHDRGITNAHDFQNKNLMQGRTINAVSEIKSFVSRHIDCNSIYGVLDKYGIKLSDVVSYEPSQYKWDRDSMFNYLNQCVDEDDYYIIYDDGNKVALIVENDNVRYFLGDAYVERGNRHEIGTEHIIFADFKKNQNDPEKIIFGIITHNFVEHESSCDRLYNERFEPITQSFNSKLKEYGLPYDIICRKCDAVEQFFNSLSSLELANLKDLIKDKRVRDALRKRERQDFIYDNILNVTFGYNSADYINLFYDAGCKLCDIIGCRKASDIAKSMINNMNDTAIHMGRSAYVPTTEEIKAFCNGNTDNYYTALYVGNFLMLMKMLDNENSREFMHRIAGAINERNRACDLFDLIMTRLIDLVDMKNDYDTSKYIVFYAYKFGSQRVINAISSQKNIDERLYRLIPPSKKAEVKTTEMWVRNNDGAYVVDYVNKESTG